MCYFSRSISLYPPPFSTTCIDPFSPTPFSSSALSPSHKDMEMRNIIDKLANFVARNGPEFEMMTQEKQRDNPKFYFLYGGEYHAYYKWKVANEQAGA